MTRTIFITGASRGFGRTWTEPFLQRVDNVAAAVRNPETLTQLTKKSTSNLLVLTLSLVDTENPPLDYYWAKLLILG